MVFLSDGRQNRYRTEYGLGAGRIEKKYRRSAIDAHGECVDSDPCKHGFQHMRNIVL